MPARGIALTRTEATAINQRALIELITGRPGIWSYLNKRLRTGRPNGLGKQGINEKNADSLGITRY